MFCREQAARFNEHLAPFTTLGAQVIAIGNGSALMAQDFVDKFSLNFDVFTDPSRKTYAAAGMHRRLGLDLSVFRSTVRALRSGHIQGRTQGDPWQQGGVLALDDEARVLFHHVDNAAGDSAPVPAVLAALAPDA